MRQLHQTVDKQIIIELNLSVKLEQYMTGKMNIIKFLTKANINFITVDREALFKN